MTLTFRAIAEGSGTITISNSGSSVLLNDGQGTNVLSGTNGASFTVIKGAAVIPSPVVTSPAPTQAVLPTPTPVSPQPLTPPTGEAPLFTDYQSPVLPSNFVVVKGTAAPNSVVTITFTNELQNGTTTVTQNTTPTTPAGAFTFVSDQKAIEGSTYTLVATTPDGQHTAPLSLPVKNSLSFVLGMWFTSIFAIKIAAWFALLVILLITLFFWRRNHLLKKHLQMVIDKLHDTQMK